MGEEPKDVARTLHQKLLAVQKHLQYFQKANENKQQHFNYVSSSQVVADLREVMDEQGVLLKSEIIGHEARLGAIATKSGGAMHWTGLAMRFTWIDADNPEDREECLWYAEGIDNSEKASGKAATYGEKYFILKFFHVPTDQDDPDAWAGKHDDDAPTPAARSGAPAQQQAPSGDGPVCDCGKQMVQRQSDRGPFYGCTGYPACKNTKNIPKAAPAAAGSDNAEPPYGAADDPGMAGPPEDDEDPFGGDDEAEGSAAPLVPGNEETAPFDEDGYPQTAAAVPAYQRETLGIQTKESRVAIRNAARAELWGDTLAWSALTPTHFRELAVQMEKMVPTGGDLP